MAGGGEASSRERRLGLTGVLWAASSGMGPEPDGCVRGVEGPGKSGCVSRSTRVGGSFALSYQGEGADLEKEHVPTCANQQAECCVSYRSGCLACRITLCTMNSNVQSHFW